MQFLGCPAERHQRRFSSIWWTEPITATVAFAAGIVIAACPAAGQALPPSAPLARLPDSGSASGKLGQLPDKLRRDFETLQVQLMIEPMLPKGKSSMFGSGPGADYWREVMAQEMAKKITASGRLHILPQVSSRPADAAGSKIPGEARRLEPRPADDTAPATSPLPSLARPMPPQVSVTPGGWRTAVAPSPPALAAR